MDKYIVSIIIPVYNGANSGLEKCLKSIIEQEILEKEIIIIDDCSEDDSLKIIKLTLGNTNVDYTIINHENNQGLSASLNDGLNISRGLYKLIIQQDCALTEKSELLESIEYMQNNEIKVLIGTPHIVFNLLSDYQKLFKIRISESSNTKKGDNKTQITQLKCDIFKSEVFSIIGDFDTTHKTIGQDFILSSRLFINNIDMYTFEKFNFIIYYEGERTMKSVCLKEFRYALAVPYISSIWRKNKFLKGSSDIQTKYKAKERFLNILFPSFFLLGLLLYIIYNNNIILYSIFIILVGWLARALSRTIPVFWKADKKWKVLFYSMTYILTDFFYSIGFMVGITYVIRIYVSKKSIV